MAVDSKLIRSVRYARIRLSQQFRSDGRGRNRYHVARAYARECGRLYIRFEFAVVYYGLDYFKKEIRNLYDSVYQRYFGMVDDIGRRVFLSIRNGNG